MRGASSLEATQSLRASPRAGHVSGVSSQAVVDLGTISMTGRSWRSPLVEGVREAGGGGMSSAGVHAAASTSMRNHLGHR